MKQSKLFILLITVVIVLISATGCFAKGPWKGKVIDSETKQPIEGAVVVAVWYKEWAGLGAGSVTSFLDAEEAITDKNGEFELPAKSFLSIPYFRKIKRPELTIFKPGYGSYPKYQVNIKAPNLTAAEYFETKGAVVELPKLKTKEERLKKLPGLPIFEHLEKVKNYVHLLNIEAKEVGLTSFYNEESKHLGIGDLH